jgi:hypothetical protein
MEFIKFVKFFLQRDKKGGEGEADWYQLLFFIVPKKNKFKLSHTKRINSNNVLYFFGSVSNPS